MANFDVKKVFKDIYQPSCNPHIIDIPEINYIMVKGEGNPNEEGGAYQQALQLLYALSYSIKMVHKSEQVPKDYYPYVVAPLEGLWWQEDGVETIGGLNKDKFCWYSMIRQPDFVDESLFAWACEQVAKKKGLDCTLAIFRTIHEGRCVQMMHIGSYDEEIKSFDKMCAFMKEQGLSNIPIELANGETAHIHHEIYLGDPRKGDPRKLRTVLRIPIHT